MRIFKLGFFISVIFQACTGNSQGPVKDTRTNRWNKFDPTKHTKIDFSKKEFDSLKGQDLAFAITGDIYTEEFHDGDEATEYSKLSPGQKAVLFYLDYYGMLEDEGILNYYENSYGEFIPGVLDGLALIGDTNMMALIRKADKIYIKHLAYFQSTEEQLDPARTPKDFALWLPMEEQFFELADATAVLLEKYIRAHPEEFVNFE